MRFNSDLKAQVAIVGHAVFKDGAITSYLRPGIDERAATFATWDSGAAIYTRRTPDGRRQVVSIALHRLAPNSDQKRVAELLLLDFADNPTTAEIGRAGDVKLSTVVFDSHAIPIPLIGKVADALYSQLYHQYHDGSVS